MNRLDALIVVRRECSRFKIFHAYALRSVDGFMDLHSLAPIPGNVEVSAGIPNCWVVAGKGALVIAPGLVVSGAPVADW